MRSPKGFGKRYFSLTAIQAYAVMPILAARQVTFARRLRILRNADASDEEEDPPPEGLCDALAGLIVSTPCHCDRLFRLRARVALHLVRLIPACTCNCRFFSFRRTGTHPPLSYRHDAPTR